jgi:hypothetical protein
MGEIHSSIIRARFFIVGFLMFISLPAYAIDCPAPSQQTSRDIALDIEGSLSALGKLLGSGDAKVHVESLVQNLFEKHPNSDKLVIVNSIISIYCQHINESNFSPSEKDDKWKTFNEQILSSAGFIKPQSIRNVDKIKQCIEFAKSIVPSDYAAISFTPTVETKNNFLVITVGVKWGIREVPSQSSGYIVPTDARNYRCIWKGDEVIDQKVSQ